MAYEKKTKNAGENRQAGSEMRCHFFVVIWRVKSIKVLSERMAEKNDSSSLSSGVFTP
jgi:hypothetical protein